MAQKNLNRVKFATGTVDDGSPIGVSITVGSALAGFLTPVDAGGVDGDIVDYCIEEDGDFEIGRGTLSSTATVLSRDEVYISLIDGVVGTTKMDLNGNGLVRFIQEAGSAPHLRAKNTWLGTQVSYPYSLTHNTAWDADLHQNLEAAVNGSNFTVANPTSVPDAGTYVSVTVSYATTHSIAFGDKFLGIESIAASNTADMEDYYVFRSDGTNLKCVGFRADIATAS